MEGLVDGGEVVEQLSERVLGRTLAEDLVDKETNKTIAENGEIITEEHIILTIRQIWKRLR